MDRGIRDARSRSAELSPSFTPTVGLSRSRALPTYSRTRPTLPRTGPGVIDTMTQSSAPETLAVQPATPSLPLPSPLPSWPGCAPIVSGSAGIPFTQPIGAAVAQVFGVDAAALDTETRGRAEVALARQVAMYLAHVACGMSLTDVGRMFSRDRTTVAHACAVIEDRRDDKVFDRAIELLEMVVSALARFRVTHQRTTV